MNKQKAAAGLALIALGAVIGGGIAFFPSNRPIAVPKVSNTPVATKTASNAPTPASSTMYKDGTYQATGSYISPAGKESVLVSLTLSSGTVTAATVTSEAKDQTAMVYQSLFVNGFKPYVVGKAIASIKVTNVAGSSLTSMGFTNALKQIERQASA